MRGVSVMNENKKVYMIGNAHLDPVWLWRWQEGYAEIKATFRSALDRMKEFPDFVFTCAGAAYYKWVEENDPEMFQEIVEKVKEGRWVIVGGWWIQPDCNVPGGESFARHSLYSQRYFLKNFGVMAKVGYNVDSFGHNGMLPQILKKSGMDYYVFMRPGDHEKEIENNLFWWESEDGSRVMTFKIPLSYGNWWSDSGDPLESKLSEVMKLSKKQNIDFMNFYGVGNHGGGPTIANLNKIREMQERWGEERVILASPNEYFENMVDQKLKLPVLKDDLQHHASGCYSTHVETKMNNRKSEHRLMNAEKYAVLAQSLMNLPYPSRKLKDAWENVMFNQFHDIMGGCSIKEAYNDAREGYGETLHIAAEITNSSLQKISWAIDTSVEGKAILSKESDWALWEIDNKGVPVVVFNPLCWEACVPVEVNKLVKGVTDDEGNPVQIQKVRASRTNGKDNWNTLFIGKIPAQGYRVYWVYKEKEFEHKDFDNNLITYDYAIENSFIKVEIDKHTGYIKSIYDKKNRVEIIKNCAAIPIVIDEYKCDTWAHNVFEFRDEIGRFSDAKIKLIESGPLRSTIRVINHYNNSALQQDFTLYNYKADIEVKVKVDWREKHKMLKLSFPLNINNPKATYEIPYGFIERPANGEEEPAQKWIDVSGYLEDCNNDVYGLALLNDSKYSFDVKDNDMRMTVMRSPIYADHYGERDELCEFMEQGIHEFKYSLVPHKGDWRETDIVRKAYEINTTFEHVIETYHKGVLSQKFQGIKVSKDNIIASVMKISEDSEDYVLRCYETCGRAVSVEIELPLLNRNWKSDFGPCEIKTFKIPAERDKSVYECNLLEI
jgi:alpha-mannosidase